MVIPQPYRSFQFYYALSIVFFTSQNPVGKCFFAILKISLKSPPHFSAVRSSAAKDLLTFRYKYVRLWDIIVVLLRSCRLATGAVFTSLISG